MVLKPLPTGLNAGTFYSRPGMYVTCGSGGCSHWPGKSGGNKKVTIPNYAEANIDVIVDSIADPPTVSYTINEKEYVNRLFKVVKAFEVVN